MAGTLRKGSRRETSRNWHYVKYLILIFLLTSALFSIHLAGIVDPLSLLIRSLAISVYPLVSCALEGTLDTFPAFHLPFVSSLGDFLYGVVKNFLSFQQPHFRQASLMGALFFGILGLNRIERRFWCRYLCALGAMLSSHSMPS